MQFQFFRRRLFDRRRIIGQNDCVLRFAVFRKFQCLGKNRTIETNHRRQNGENQFVSHF